jgi:hypothetical protein
VGVWQPLEVATTASEPIAVVSQRKTQEVQALARLVQLDDARLLAIDGHPKSSLQQFFNPADQLPRLRNPDNHKPAGRSNRPARPFSRPPGGLRPTESRRALSSLYLFLIPLGLVLEDARTHESTDQPGNSGFGGGV